MSAITKIAQEVKQDYERKYEAYLKAAVEFELIDKELFDLLIKKAAGCKMMLDNANWDKF